MDKNDDKDANNKIIKIDFANKNLESTKDHSPSKKQSKKFDREGFSEILFCIHSVFTIIVGIAIIFYLIAIW